MDDDAVDKKNRVARAIERHVFDVADSVQGGEQEWRDVQRSMDHCPVPLVQPPPDDGRSAMSSSAVVARGRMYGAAAPPLVPLALSPGRG